MNLIDMITNSYSDLKNNGYFINNLISDNTKYVFVLESPHKKEIEHKVPVAGGSGKSMSKNIFGKDISKALGMIVNDAINFNDNQHPLAKNIGLINVCQIPMQGTAYKNEIYENNKNFIDIMEYLREKFNNKTPLNEEQLIVENIINENFKEQLEYIKNKKCYIIPCGNFARKYFEKANVQSDNWNIISDIPHPSYNLWNRKKETMELLNSILI